MEVTTAKNEAASPNARTTKETPKPSRDVWFRRSREFAMLAARPMANVWDQYLREPVAKGLIVTGVILTETGRFVRKAGASKAPADPGMEKVLH